MANFVETDCKFTHEGRTFEAGGAWLCDCTDGFKRGVVYAKPIIRIAEGCPAHGVVTDWHGNEIAKAVFGVPYQGNFCKLRSVSFTVDGVKFTGRYCPDWADAVKVRSTKRVS